MNSYSLSLIIPVYHDEGIIEECYREVREAFSGMRGTVVTGGEIIFVDDGSRDGTLEKLRALCSNDPDTRVVELDQNYGQHAAITAGFEVAAGDVIVTLDSDLQIRPGEIPALLKKIDEGHDLVSGVRLARKDSFVKRTLPSRFFNRLVGHITGVHLRDWGCPTVALTNELAKRLLRHGELRRFLKPLGARLAHSVAEVELPHNRRIGGASAYRFQDLFDLALDFITNFSRRPFQKVSLVGMSFFGAGFLGGILYLLLRFLAGVQPGNRIQALIFLAVVIGLQLMILGFLGEFIIRIYRRQNNLPFYTIRKIHGGKEA